MKKLIILTVLAWCLWLPVIPAEMHGAGHLNDIEVLYLYETPENIDWPLIYYLGVEQGCQINLVTVSIGPGFKFSLNESDRYDIRRYRFYLPDTTNEFLDSIITIMIDWRLPDLVILSGEFTGDASQAFEEYLLNIPLDIDRVLNIYKIIRRADTDKAEIFLNRASYISELPKELTELAEDFSERLMLTDTTELYSSYGIVEDRTSRETARATFIGGMERLKLYRIADRYIENTIVRDAMRNAMDEYIRLINDYSDSVGADQMEILTDALGALRKLEMEYYADVTSDSSSIPGRYIDYKTGQVSDAILHLADIHYEIETVRRDSPEGWKLKLILKIFNNGSYRIAAGRFKIRPFWQKELITVETETAEIQPFNSLIREYNLDIDPDVLSEAEPESVMVYGTIRYKGKSIDIEGYASFSDEGAVSVRLMPDFMIVRPFPELQVDRLVEPVRLKAEVTKPEYQSIEADVKVEVSSGMKVGAYKMSIDIPKGNRSDEFSIPLVATRSMKDDGKESVIIDIISNKNIIATDTAFVSLADVAVSRKINIALLSGREGLLEDILVMTGADYKTISNRFLETANLDVYDIILLETGCLENYPSLKNSHDRLRDYMVNGGTVLILGQPEDWPEDIGPVSIITMEDRLSLSGAGIVDTGHELFKKVDMTEVLKSADSRLISYPALVTPADILIGYGGQAALLTETRFGQGKLIYCGLPLPEMFRELKDETMEFFARLVNYSGQ